MTAEFEYVLKELDLRNKVILDAATGAGSATLELAKGIDEQGGTSKIYSVDISLPREWREKISQKLGEYGKYVELVEADIFKLTRYFDKESIDIVNCHHTMVFLNPVPLKFIQALREFYWVLDTGGILVLTSELPITDHQTPEYEGQWRRWNLAKAIYQLNGKTWSTEPLPAEVRVALRHNGFAVYQEQLFPARKNETTYRAVIDEWREVMLKEIAELPWSEGLTSSLKNEVEEIHQKVISDGYLMVPPTYVFLCRRG